MGFFDSVIDFFTLKKNPEKLRKELTAEAHKWVGIHERRGEDSIGVNSFRKAVDNVADGEPWCAAFVGYCVRSVSLRTKAKIAVYLSELSTDMWYKTPSKYKLSYPVPGAIVIWKYKDSIHGHTGIVSSIDSDGRITTVEGNTKPPGITSVSGTGVYIKNRSRSGTEEMKVLGYVLPFVG